MTINTRSIVIAGVLIAVAAVLALTGLGYFPVPNVTAQATIMHVPAIIGGVLEGPVVGLLVGLVFAADALIKFAGLPIFAGAPAWAPFVVLFIPRLLIGVVAWLVYRGLRGSGEYVALVVAAILGTLTNTVGVLGLAVLLGLLGPEVFAASALQAAFEAVVAAVLTVAVVAAWKNLDTGRRRGSTV